MNIDAFYALLGALAAVFGIVFGAITVFAANRKSRKKESERDGSVMTELGYIKSGIDDIKRKQEKQDEKIEKQHIEIIGRLTAVEESAKSAHKRLDTIEMKGKGE